MTTDQFRLSKSGFIFDVVEDNENDVVSYAVTIVKPENFAQFQEMEQPVYMKYNPDTGELVWDSVQDLGLKDVESLLSNLILNRNA